MDDNTLFLNLHTILSNNQFSTQFIYFCCGLYNNPHLNTEFQTKGMYYIIGKLLCICRQDMIHYINYLLIIIQNKDSVLRAQYDIATIDNLHVVLQSRQKNDFLMFLYGVYNQEDWGESEKYGDSFIVGRILDIQEPKISIGCKFILGVSGSDMNIVNSDV